jgi:hypothetical protein
VANHDGHHLAFNELDHPPEGFWLLHLVAVQPADEVLAGVPDDLAEAPHKGVSSLSPDNAFAAKVSACYKGCVSSRGSQGKTLACLFDFGLVLETIEHAWRDRRGHHRLAV